MPKCEPKVHIYWRVKEGETQYTYVGKVTLSIPKDEERVVTARCWFWIDEGQIYIAEINVEKGYKKLRYGTLIINILKGYAEVMRYPLVLCSADNAIEFYKKLGFMSMKDKKRDKRVSANYQISEPDELDVFWIPKSMKKRKKIKLIF